MLHTAVHAAVQGKRGEVNWYRFNAKTQVSTLCYFPLVLRWRRYDMMYADIGINQVCPMASTSQDEYNIVRHHHFPLPPVLSNPLQFTPP